MKKNNVYKHVLVLRFSALGDVAMTVPVLIALRKTYPNLRITVVSRAFFKPLFAGIDNIDFVAADFKNEHKGVWGLRKLFKITRALGVDAVADIHHVLRTQILKRFFFAHRIPVIQIDKGRAEKKALTKWSTKELAPIKTTHERYADVFGGLGFPVNMKEAHFLETKDFPDKAIALGIDSSKPAIGIAPFAAFEGKMYPLELMKEVIASFNKTGNYQILLFGGGKEETAQLEAIASKFEGVFNMAGKLQFAEELALISNLKLMLAMDSGNAHLAANYGIPVVTIWGVTHPVTGFAPYAQPLENAILADRAQFPFLPTSVYGNKQPKGYEKVMDTIKPATVVTTLQRVLAD